MDIYPFHRVNESASAKRVNRTAHIAGRRSHGVNIVLPRFNLQSAGEMLSEFTPQLLLYYLVMGLGAVIMARAFILGELLPFAFAYMAVFGLNNRTNALWIGICSIIGMASVLSGFAFWSDLVAMLALMATIIVMPIPKNKAWWAVPFLTAAIIMVGQGIFMLNGEWALYDAMVNVFEAAIAGVLTFIFLVCDQALKKKQALRDFSYEEIGAFLVLSIGMVIGLNEVYVFNLSLGSILGRFGVLAAAFIWGSGGGTMVGVMIGLVPSLASSIFAQTLGLYAISGMLAGLCRNFGRLGVFIGFMLGNIALTMFINETDTAVLSLWESITASILFFLLPASIQEQVPARFSVSTSKMPPVSLQGHIADSIQLKLENLAKVFEEISCALAPENENYTAKDHSYVNYLYDEINRGICHGCFRRGLCWGKESFNTAQELLDLFTIAETDGEVKYEDISPDFRRHCVHDKEMIDIINHLFENLRIYDYWSQKLGQSREMVTLQLDGVSRVIRDLSKEMNLNMVADNAMRERIMRESRRLNLDIIDCDPIRLDERQLYLKVKARPCSDQSGCEQIARQISVGLGYPLELKEKNCRGFSGCEFTLCRALSYRIKMGIAQLGKELDCGDSCCSVGLDTGYHLLALSDGMGVGQAAAAESKTAVNLLKSLLSCGFDRNLTLKTINSVLLLRSLGERFATLDIVMIDLYIGTADFIKIGSAPTLIKRDRHVEVINSNSWPAGIMDEIEFVTEKVRLNPHDIVVVLSDGVMDVSRQQGRDNWLYDFLPAVQESDPQILAELIVNRAMELCTDRSRDDMTVLCAYIDKN